MAITNAPYQTPVAQPQQVVTFAPSAQMQTRELDAFSAFLGPFSSTIRSIADRKRQHRKKQEIQDRDNFLAGYQTQAMGGLRQIDLSSRPTLSDKQNVSDLPEDQQPRNPNFIERFFGADMHFKASGVERGTQFREALTSQRDALEDDTRNYDTAMVGDRKLSDLDWSNEEDRVYYRDHRYLPQYAYDAIPNGMEVKASQDDIARVEAAIAQHMQRQHNETIDGIVKGSKDELTTSFELYFGTGDGDYFAGRQDLERIGAKLQQMPPEAAAKLDVWSMAVNAAFMAERSGNYQAIEILKNDMADGLFMGRPIEEVVPGGDVPKAFDELTKLKASIPGEKDSDKQSNMKIATHQVTEKLDAYIYNILGNPDLANDDGFIKEEAWKLIEPLTNLTDGQKVDALATVLQVFKNRDDGKEQMAKVTAYVQTGRLSPAEGKSMIIGWADSDYVLWTEAKTHLTQIRTVEEQQKQLSPLQAEIFRRTMDTYYSILEKQFESAASAVGGIEGTSPSVYGTMHKQFQDFGQSLRQSLQSGNWYDVGMVVYNDWQKLGAGRAEAAKQVLNSGFELTPQQRSEFEALAKGGSPASQETTTPLDTLLGVDTASVADSKFSVDTSKSAPASWLGGSGTTAFTLPDGTTFTPSIGTFTLTPSGSPGTFGGAGGGGTTTGTAQTPGAGGGGSAISDQKLLEFRGSLDPDRTLRDYIERLGLSEAEASDLFIRWAERMDGLEVAP